MSLHHAFVAEEKDRLVIRWATEDESALMAVQVEGKAGSSRQEILGFPKHGAAAQVVEAIVGVGKEEDNGVGRGLWSG